jgi:hypothetical protein
MGIVRYLQDVTRASDRQTDTPATRREEPYSVCIVPFGSCCTAAKDLAERRYLYRTAPSLPLASCTMPKACNCCYRKFIERRTQRRRWVCCDVWAGADRRTTFGRRATDLPGGSI